MCVCIVLTVTDEEGQTDTYHGESGVRPRRTGREWRSNWYIPRRISFGYIGFSLWWGDLIRL